MAQVMKRMVDINKENECTFRKPFPATHDSKFKLRFTTSTFKKNTDVRAVYKNRLGELTLRLLHGTVVNTKDHLNNFSTLKKTWSLILLIKLKGRRACL